ncbi:unnamed protein product [Arabidopsis thaliana]|uniref:(thale cress) hypothetical protein n=1 Tax=Arabidopsis thaliana TaxID=3702 RepID=A0A7G2F311_ARATH|nr:unnamed protein product [Arabidopsis thaliana]
MSSLICFIFLFLFSFITSFTASAQNPFYLYHNCSITTTYSSNSTYSTNLKTLLSSLSSRNASYSTGFQNATAGQAPDMVTGLFLCRGNVSPEVCRSCIALSVNESLSRCPNEREAVFYYEQCMLRYSNRNILSTLNTDGGVFMQNARNPISVKQDRFRDLVLNPMNLAAIEAARSIKRFAVTKFDLNALQSLYGMVQCTPDLTEQDCLDCLQQSINQVTYDKIGGRTFLPSCTSRYDNYEFYNEFNVGTPQDSSPRPGKGGNSSVIVIAVVVPITVLFLLFVAFFSVRRAKRKKTIGAIPLFKVKRKETEVTEPLAENGDDITTAGSLQFDFKAIVAATDIFLPINKLGQGGFGEVYKYCGSGYMAPEYAMYGKFSMKSDVYSFGVLVLEIVSGMKNSSLDQMDGSISNLVTYTWRLWSNGSPSELVDPSFGDNYQTSEITRCIHIALLCVQEDANDRPTMSAIVQMLTTSSIALAVPRPPGFFLRSKQEQAERACPSMDTSDLFSIDEASITSVAPR